MKKKLLSAFIFIGLVLPAIPQIKTLQPTIQQPVLTLAKPKIHVTGFAAYYGNAKYISASLTLDINGKPLKNVKVWINNSLLNSQGNGTYNGSIPSTYKIRRGNELVFTAEFPKTLYRSGFPPPFQGKVELGTYRIKNIIHWVWPKPGQTVSLMRVISLLFKWDFTGSTSQIEFFLKDKKTNTQIYSKILTGEQQNVPANLFKTGKEYVMGLWAAGPIDQFKLTKNCSPRSKIDWYFSSLMVFNTGKGLMPMIRK